MKPPQPRFAWLQIAGLIVLLLALAMVVLAWQREEVEQRQAEDIGARVQAEMNRIEAEAQRLEQDATQ